MSNRRCFGVLMALFVVLFAVLAVAPFIAAAALSETESESAA